MMTSGLHVIRADETPSSTLQVLQATGRPLFGDTELQTLAISSGIAAAWARGLEQRGPALLTQVGGSFSVAWRNPQGHTFLAIDRFAIQSLCYRHEGTTLRFAERADELSTRHEGDLDPQALYDYLFFHAIPSPRTVFKQVQRLVPGHVAEFDPAGRLSVRAYWQPRFQAAPTPDFNQMRERFRDRLKEATRRQLDGSKPACFLSGGTDSSTVAGMIGLAGSEPAHTYSIGFEAEGYDEMAFARIAAKHFGCPHHEYYVTPADLVDRMATVARHYDQPFGNSSAVPAYFCARMAQADGVTRILAGDGGDELFGGNTRYAKQTVFGWYGRIPTAVRTGFLEPLLKRDVLGSWPGLKKAASYSEQARVQMPDRLQSYNLLKRLGMTDVLTADFLAHVNPEQPRANQRQVWQSINADNDIDRMLAFDWRYTLAETDLPKVTGTAALAGVSVGFPMLDTDLLEMALHLPADWKVKRLKLRWFFKQALKGFLPDDIIRKPKQGFGLPFGVWAHRNEALFGLCESALHSLAARNIVRRDFIERLLREHLPSHPKFYGEMIWILVMLELWLGQAG